MEPPEIYDQERERDKWMDQFWIIIVAGFASAGIVLFVMMMLNG